MRQARSRSMAPGSGARSGALAWISAKSARSGCIGRGAPPQTKTQRSEAASSARRSRNPWPSAATSSTIAVGAQSLRMARTLSGLVPRLIGTKAAPALRTAKIETTASTELSR